jgi:hypothetical protein
LGCGVGRHTRIVGEFQQWAQAPVRRRGSRGIPLPIVENRGWRGFRQMRAAKEPRGRTTATRRRH